eukprot:3050829-Pyramimonas_sp.AAC.1
MSNLTAEQRCATIVETGLDVKRILSEWVPMEVARLRSDHGVRLADISFLTVQMQGWVEDSIAAALADFKTDKAELCEKGGKGSVEYKADLPSNPPRGPVRLAHRPWGRVACGGVA